MYKLNTLFNDLIPVIKDRTNPFDTITIVVPSKKIEQWFKTYYLKNYNDVLMNVKFQTLNSFFLSLADNEYKLINKNIVKAHFIKYILGIPDISASKLPNILKNYLSGDKLIPIKIHDLANKLTDLYVSYDLDDILDDKINKDDSYKEVDEQLFDDGYISLSRLYKSVKHNGLDKNTYFFGFSNLSIIENKILEPFISKYKDNFFTLDKKSVLSYNLLNITATPSKFREVENLHSKICELLLNDKEHKLSLSDFLVLAPNISEYRSIIASLFKQDNINYVDLPYTICYKDENSNHIYRALKVLFDVYNNKSFTRTDFISLIENKIVKYVRNINDEGIDAIKQAILNSNTYRNKDDGSYDDWDILKKRLLASKILLKSDNCDSYITIKDKDYASFASLSLDDARIINIVSLIDDLNEIISLNSDDKTRYEYIEIKTILDKYFSIKENDIETNAQYKKLLDEIETFKRLEIILDKKAFNILFYHLLEVAGSNRFISGELFTKGVTCLDLDDKSILNAKYLFILGCDSKSLDFTQIKNEIDVRNDASFTEKTNTLKTLFKLQAANGDNLYVSFINQDLKSDEKFFISPLIEEIDPTIVAAEMKLDETRDYSKLFTRREKENKEYYIQLLKGDINNGQR